LNTHVLGSAPRELVSRVTALTGAAQNVVVSLAIAAYATYLQGQTAAHLAAAGFAAAGGPVVGEGAPRDSLAPAPAALQQALAAAFGDVYALALAAAGIALLLALTLRRPYPSRQ
jgi:hypothetical protein